LAAWLYGVARRVANKARVRARRHGPLPVPLPADPRADPLAEMSARELLAILDEEIERLPEAYRLPVVLCCLEGLSQEEAAHRLGWTPGSVKGRLERGRVRLHARLARRGLPLSVLLAAPEVPADLIRHTLRTASAAGTAATESCALSAEVLSLAEGFSHGGTVTGLKVGLAFLAAVLAVASGGMLARPAPAEKPPAKQPERPGTA